MDATAETAGGRLRDVSNDPRTVLMNWTPRHFMARSIWPLSLWHYEFKLEFKTFYMALWLLDAQESTPQLAPPEAQPLAVPLRGCEERPQLCQAAPDDLGQKELRL